DELKIAIQVTDGRIDLRKPNLHLCEAGYAERRPRQVAARLERRLTLLNSRSVVRPIGVEIEEAAFGFSARLRLARPNHRVVLITLVQRVVRAFDEGPCPFDQPGREQPGEGTENNL